MRSFPLQTGLAILAVGALLAGARLVNPTVKGPDPAQLEAIVDFEPDRVPLSPLSRRVEPEPVMMPKGKGVVRSQLLEDSNGGLDLFYQALWETEKHEPGAITRVSHYGDSPTTADLITGDIRAQLQQRYGDAGHGFILIDKPWAWYQHAGVQLSASGWQSMGATHFQTRDGLYGLGGVSFTGTAGDTSQFLYTSGQSNFEIWFLKQPNGGDFTVSADAKELGRVETAADERAAGFASFPVETPAKRLDIRVDRGGVRLFGITAEKSGPGVVYDSLGLNGASITVLSHMFNEAHWTEQLAHRKPNLVVINYGTNEADFDAFVDHQYEGELREAIRRVRAALPESSILVMSPMDRGHRAPGGAIETMPTIPRIVALQKRVAQETGCGFFDTFDAMGGTGTMARWYNDQPRLVSADFIHPYPAGGKKIATIFTKEIGDGLNRYKLRQVQSSQAKNHAGSAVR